LTDFNDPRSGNTWIDGRGISGSSLILFGCIVSVPILTMIIYQVVLYKSDKEDNKVSNESYEVTFIKQ